MSVSDLISKNLKTSKPSVEPIKKKTTKKKESPEKKDDIPQEYKPVPGSRSEKELQLLEIKVKTAETNYQQLMRSVVLREEIQHVWNKIYRSASYFADFPSRYSGEFAAALGVSDPEKIQQMERLMAEAVELFISEFAESVADQV